MPRPKGTTQYSPEMIYRAADLFLHGPTKINEIIRQLEQEFPCAPLHRQEVYRLVRYAVTAKFVRLMPPLEPTLADQIAERFRFEPDQKVTVVRTPRPEDNHLVAEAAADVALARARELLEQRGQQSVGLGLTIGRASADFARQLAELMQATRAFPFSLHALAGGGPTDTEYSPISFFNYFRRDPSLARQEGPPHAVGLFTPTVCGSADELARIRARADFQKALSQRERINLICASIGVQCEHDLLRRAIEDEMRCSGHKDFDYAQWAKQRKIVANINYRPFTSTGDAYIERKNDHRAITLFEIPELLTFRQRGGMLVLIARRCGSCNDSGADQQRARGLLPLLQSPRLRVFSDLVIDGVLARLVIALTQSQAGS